MTAELFQPGRWFALLKSDKSVILAIRKFDKHRDRDIAFLGHNGYDWCTGWLVEDPDEHLLVADDVRWFADDYVAARADYEDRLR